VPPGDIYLAVQFHYCEQHWRGVGYCSHNYVTWSRR